MISNILGYEINVKEIVERFKTKYEDLAKYKSYAIPVARDMIPKLKLLGFNEENITFSPIGPTDDVFEISPNFESLQFLAIGRFTETKAPHNTILAFNEVLKKFPDAKLVMAGSGEMMDFCVNLVEELGIKDKVNFIGWISKEQMKKLFLESSVFVQHSVTAKNGDKEGTPVVILEASAAGLPIVSTFHAGIPDTVIHEETGFLVEENDWKSMARYMQELLLDKELYQNMSIKGKEFVRSHFSMKAHLEVIQNIIDKL